MEATGWRWLCKKRAKRRKDEAKREEEEPRNTGEACKVTSAKIISIFNRDVSVGGLAWRKRFIVFQLGSTLLDKATSARDSRGGERFSLIVY